MAKYLLGVDGGNTKCDYLLYTVEGKLTDILRTGTCSHEALPGGYDEADALMRAHVEALLARNGLGMGDIAAAAMGLAGLDLPDQREAMLARIGRWGMGLLDARNDAVLGLKGGSPSGTGVCVVNGTGTVLVGMDDEGGYLQIGGIGELTCDAAGGMHVAVRLCQTAYDQLYRGYPRTPLSDEVLALLGLRDDEYMMAAHMGRVLTAENVTRLNLLTQRLAIAGDRDARAILDDMGERLGRSAAACVERLRFREPVTMVLVGSVFVKCVYPGLLECFERYLYEGTPLETETVLLGVPPCVGAVLWAQQLLLGRAQTAAEREGITSQLPLARYEEIVFGR